MQAAPPPCFCSAKMADNHLQVAIRCQPSAEEKAWRVQNDSIELPGDDLGADKTTPLISFTFDRVLTETFSHAQFYDKVVAPSVRRLIKGEVSNVAVMAYGVPCTGKSYTVFGTSGQTRVKPEARGVIMRCGEQLFAELSKAPNITSRVVASFFHVFESGDGKSSRVADLFDMKKRDLEIVEDSSTLQYSIPELTEQNVTCSQDILSLVEKGYLMRNATGCVKEPIRRPAVKFGAVSQPLQQYRPHSSNAIFTLTCERLEQGEDVVSVSRIIVIDLAGRGIEEIHSENPCSDAGIKTLHDVLKALVDNGRTSAAATLYPRSSLTKFLKPCLGGNCDTVVIGNVCLKGSAVDLTKKCLQILSDLRKIKNYPRVIKIPTSQSSLGKCLEEGERGRMEITAKLGVDAIVKKVEVIGDREVKVDDSLHEDTTSSFLNLAKQVTSAEAQLVRGGEPLQKPLNSSIQKQGNAAVQPLAMVRPLYPPSHNTSSSITATLKPLPGALKSKTPSPLVKSTVAEKETTEKEAKAAPFGLLTPPSKQDIDATSSISSYSLEASDSDFEDKEPTTPVLTGPPPPPLRGIPHLNPDEVDIGESDGDEITPRSQPTSTITNVIPSHSWPLPSTLLTTPGGFGGPGNRPNLHPVPPLTSPQSSRPPVTVIPHATVIHHGESPSSTIPLAPLSPTRHQMATFNLQLDRTLEEGASPGGSSSTVSTDQLPQLSREPILVSPGTSTVRPLAPSPIATAQMIKPASHPVSHLASQPASHPVSPPASHPVSHLATTPTSLPVQAKTAWEPPVPPPSSTRRKESVDQQNRSKERISSESSSSESLDSESESVDLEEEARDKFDPRMQQRTLQRLKPIQHTLLPLHPTGGHAGGIADHPQLPVLPPIPSLGGNRSDVLPPITTPPPSQIPLPAENPPTYRETTGNQSLPSACLPNYATVGSRGREDTFYPPDLTQYMSNEEIHIAASEGVSSSQMKSLALQYGVDFRDHGGRTPLMYTIIGNQPKMCSMLIKLKASVNALDSSGMTPLLWATYLAKPDIIKTLLRNGADVHQCDPAGRSSFHWAMKTPNIQCLKWLCKFINSPVIVNQPDNEGLTPLHMAVMSDQPGHIKLLLTSSNADVGVQDRDGRTALNFAVLIFSPACIRTILDCCESAVNLIDNKGRTALHYACAEGSADCVRTLLSYHSCDLHCADNKGTTPLHWAAAANQPGLVQLLLRRGADRTIRDYEDMLPLNYAEQRGHTECIKLLQNYGHRRPVSAVSHVALPPPTTTPTLDEHGHIQLRNPTRRFSLSGESLTSFDRRLPADGQAQMDDNVFEVEQHRLQMQMSVSDEVDYREECEGEQNQWAETRQLHQSPRSGGTTSPPQPSRTPRRRWIRILLCGCASQRNNVVAPRSY